MGRAGPIAFESADNPRQSIYKKKNFQFSFVCKTFHSDVDIITNLFLRRRSSSDQTGDAPPNSLQQVLPDLSVHFRTLNSSAAPSHPAHSTDYGSVRRDRSQVPASGAACSPCQSAPSARCRPLLLRAHPIGEAEQPWIPIFRVQPAQARAAGAAEAEPENGDRGARRAGIQARRCAEPHVKGLRRSGAQCDRSARHGNRCRLLLPRGRGRAPGRSDRCILLPLFLTGSGTRSAAGMLKTTAIHGKLKDGVQYLLFGNASIVARIVGIDGPTATLRDAITQVRRPAPAPIAPRPPPHPPRTLRPTPRRGRPRSSPARRINTARRR